MSRRTLALVGVFMIALGVRVAYNVTTGHSTRVVAIESEIAHNILEDGRWFVRNEAADVYVGKLYKRYNRSIDPASIDYAKLDRYGPWYPEISDPVGSGLVTAAVWAITGDQRNIQVQLLQSLVDALAALLVYWIAMQLFARLRVALLAAALYAIYPPIAWLTDNIYADIWAIDFTIAIVAIFLVIERSQHRWRWLVVCGLVAGVGAYFRPQVLILAPVLALVRVPATGRREAVRRAVTPVVVSLLVIAPWTVRNYYEFHMLIPVRTGFWETMVEGMHELPNDYVRPIEAEIRRAHPTIGAETPAWDEQFKPYFARVVVQHPLFYLEILAYRVALATVLEHDLAWMHRGAGSIFHQRDGPLAFVADHPLATAEYALQPAVFILAMLGLGFGWRRWRKQNTLLLAVVLCVLLPYIATHVESRYLLPAAFVYFIWIALGVELAAGRLRGSLALSSRAERRTAARRWTLRPPWAVRRR
jgi:4-amino-4-deoxy-L-arabinose transferase-like glycosyltransferase